MVDYVGTWLTEALLLTLASLIIGNSDRKMVTKSMFELLTSYSSPFPQEIFWTDALCINQNSKIDL